MLDFNRAPVQHSEDPPASTFAPPKERYVRWRDLKPAIQGRESEIVDKLGISWRTRQTHIQCPLGAHPDNNPSFRWDDKGGRYYCSCGSGSAVDLIIKVEKVDFEQAKIRAADLIERHDLIKDPSSPAGLTLQEYTSTKRLPIDELQRIGVRQSSYGQVKAAIRTPYFRLNGEPSVRFRVNLNGDKNKRHYWRRGDKACLYGEWYLGSPGFLAVGYIVIVEGESDCQTCWFNGGFPALGLPGAGQWNEERDAPLLAGVHTVFAVVEPDEGGKVLLSRITRSSIAPRVRLVRLPEGTKDPSALYLRDPAGFPAAFKAALDAAQPIQEELIKATQNDNPPVADHGVKPPYRINSGAPYRTAKFFRSLAFSSGGTPILYHHQDVFHAWNGTAYAIFGDNEMKAKLYAFLDQCVVGTPDGGTQPFNPNLGNVADVLGGLRAASNLPDTISAPCWLDQTPDIDPADIIACQNGLVHLDSMSLLPHTPLFFTHNALDFAYEPNAPEPVAWNWFLNQLWPADPASILTLQEIFGYFLNSDTRQQKLFMIVGQRRSGKGTIGRVLTRLVGPNNVVSPTLAGLGTNFGIEPLIGKLVGIIGDARLGGKADQQTITERLLSISGEDGITVDRKFIKAWTGRMQIRFLILSNELPRFVDSSGALVSRFILLRLTESFYGREDHGLTDRLLLELPSILNWAIAGLMRLRGRGYFLQPASAADALQQMEDLASPIGAFLRERCRIGPEFDIGMNRLFEVWCEWGRAQGREHIGTAQTFGRDLRAALPGLGSGQRRTEDGRQMRIYKGLTLCP
jgi:P4 family phage/plasmid primase-like protien